MSEKEAENKDKLGMYFSSGCYYDRNDNNKYNKVLKKINKKFSSVRKVDGIFELFFEDDGQLKIIECCDYYFRQRLSSKDLKQLAQYFLLVAYFMERSKMSNENNELNKHYIVEKQNQYFF